ncbi:MAG: hypothetical protein NC210_02495 [[Clostridium] fimetarium]|nr:hypothetical protein [Alistipes timonensis]MCM1405271.1 hypothetical protein [[Clostridium] fimetarium]
MKKLITVFSLLLALAVAAPEISAQDNAAAPATEAPAKKKEKKKVRPIEEIVAEMAAKCPDKEADGSVLETVMIVENNVFMKTRLPIPAEGIGQLNQHAAEMKPMFISQMAAANDPETREFFKALRKSGKGFTFIIGPLEGDDTVTLTYTPEEIKAAR